MPAAPRPAAAELLLLPPRRRRCRSSVPPARSPAAARLACSGQARPACASHCRAAPQAVLLAGAIEFSRRRSVLCTSARWSCARVSHAVRRPLQWRTPGLSVCGQQRTSSANQSHAGCTVVVAGRSDLDDTGHHQLLTELLTRLCADEVVLSVSASLREGPHRIAARVRHAKPAQHVPLRRPHSLPHVHIQRQSAVDAAAARKNLHIGKQRGGDALGSGHAAKRSSCRPPVQMRQMKLAFQKFFFPPTLMVAFQVEADHLQTCSLPGHLWQGRVALTSA